MKRKMISICLIGMFLLMTWISNVSAEPRLDIEITVENDSIGAVIKNEGDEDVTDTSIYAIGSPGLFGIIGKLEFEGKIELTGTKYRCQGWGKHHFDIPAGEEKELTTFNFKDVKIIGTSIICFEFGTYYYREGNRINYFKRCAMLCLRDQERLVPLYGCKLN